ncbi:VOC family protein [Halorussus salilacus]|uniref:VOC family protein n=1 Tax=Halorussus salilacus TaxID=2953750 RepID=UPI00209FC12C|nr:VOC family protein [Halorussus salilacus]USZ68273.1 VOC family protein [Halorussus salilacus]
MLSGLRWLALEAKYLDRARSFYETHLDLSVARERDGEVVFDAGDAALVLREPGAVPRGGVHTHYAFAAPPDRYDAWRERLSPEFDLTEFDFGGSRSLYFYDPDGNCVEIGGVGEGDDPISGVFEIVLEVEDLARAESFYTDLGFEPTDRGDRRRRVRLGGPVDLELWEPQLGIADARGGLHVDVGFAAEDPEAAADAVADRACSVEEVEDPDREAVRVRDPDGHYLTFG